MSEFTGKTAVVTGASGNLGAAVAFKLIQAGANLVLVDRSLEILKNIYEDFNIPDKVFYSAPTNVLDRNEVQEITKAALVKFGTLDILINTVGGYRAGTPTHETDLDTWDFMIDLNARSVLITSSAVVPQMIEKRDGKIINIASRAALTGNKNAAAYSASKSAVMRITESMSAELKDYGININCVIPGTIDTPQNREAMPDANYQTWVSPDSIADVIVFLVSDAARHIHGAAIPIYGLS